MQSLTLEPRTRDAILDAISGDALTVACLCAAWCGTCSSYRATFEDLATRHPDKTFVWIDIEDQADLVGDLDVDNFPTLLVQAQAELSAEELARLAQTSEERRSWQRDCNLRVLLVA